MLNSSKDSVWEISSFHKPLPLANSYVSSSLGNGPETFWKTIKMGPTGLGQQVPGTFFPSSLLVHIKLAETPS